jgi:tetratricopeptide (TPR) repeat protein
MMRTKMALMHAQEAEYERAIEFCRGAIQVQKHQPALKGSMPKFIDETDLASLMVLIIERLENARACLEDHKELLDKIDLHSTVSDFTEIETIQSSSTKEIMLDMLERSAHDDQSAIFQYDELALEMLSVHAAEQDKHDEGIKYCRDALQIHLVALGLKHPRAGKSLLRVARMYRGKGSDRHNEELVLGYFQQTAAVLQRSNLSQRARVSVLNDIAVIHMRRLDFDEAIKFLLDALHAYDEEIDDDSISGGRHIATLRVWRNLGECYMQLEKFSIAEGALLKALAIQRDCRKMQDAAEKLEIRAIKLDRSLGKLTSDTSIADTICRIGKARAGGGDYKKAIGIYRDALVVLNRTLKSDDSTELEQLEKRDQLTHTLYCIAKAESANKEYEKALGMYHLSLKLRNAHGAEKKDKRVSSCIHRLSCFVGIGDVFMKQKDFDRAITQFRASLEYAAITELRQDHPMMSCAQQKLKEAEKAMKAAAKKSPRVVFLEKKADAEIERGALDMATETLKELLVIHRASLKRLKDNEQDTSEQVYAIACLLQTFGFVFAKNGDDENAERAFKDASRLFRKGGQQGVTRTTL